MSAAVETMAYAGEVPWHGLGVKIPADLTPAQIQKAAGLDWTVEKIDTFFANPKNKLEALPTGRQVLVRSTDQRVLTHVSDTWNPVQNSEAFEFFDDVVSSGDMDMHTAGSLRDGEIVWALAKVRAGFTLFGGDEVESFLLFSNPHQFGKTVEIRFTPIRVVCNNTLSLSLNMNAKNAVRISHHREFNAAMAKQMLGLASDQLQDYKELAQILGAKRFTDPKLEQYFKDVFPRVSDVKETGELSRAASRALEIMDTQPGAKYARGSWWQALNAVTYLMDHELGRNADSRMQSSWFGTNAQKKVKALHKAHEYAKVA